MEKKWYKTWPGAIFLVFISLAILGAIIFMAFFAYYLWQAKYGDAEKIAEEFKKEREIMMSASPLFTQKQAVAAPAVVEEMDKYLRGHNPVAGEKSASVTVFAFMDFECPFSRQAHPDFKKMMDKYSPVVRVVFKYLPLQDLHPQAVTLANAAACANEQEKFWEYQDLLFKQPAAESGTLVSYAGNLGLNKNKFSQCLSTEKYNSQIEQDLLDAAGLGLRGTPTFFVNGIKIEGVMTGEEWDGIITGLLKEL